MDNQTLAQNAAQQGQPSNMATSNGMPPFNATGSMQPTTRLVPVSNSGAKSFSKQTLWMVIAIVAGLAAVTFIALFIWMYSQWSSAKTDVDGQIEAAVATAVNEKAEEMENQFVEREKIPYSLFAGPVDYGELAFEYPKTWSVYVAEAATTGGDFNAYFNPIQVDAVGKETVNALRVTIRDESFDDVTEEYQKAMDKKDSNLTITSVTIGKDQNITANRYTGTIPNTDLSGFIVTFKIRDKTAVLQTDSVLFQADFDKLLGTVTFNE